MSQAKHTPGPWRLPTKEEARRWWAPVLILDAEGGSLANAQPGFPCDEETIRANAQLIAAAPDLLAALETGVELFELDEEANRPGTDAFTWLHQARAAIAKARGEEAA